MLINRMEHRLFKVLLTYISRVRRLRYHLVNEMKVLPTVPHIFSQFLKAAAYTEHNFIVRSLGFASLRACFAITGRVRMLLAFVLELSAVCGRNSKFLAFQTINTRMICRWYV